MDFTDSDNYIEIDEKDFTPFDIQFSLSINLSYEQLEYMKENPIWLY